MVMNLKNLMAVLVFSVMMSLGFQSCKSKVSDTDLKAKVESAVAGNPNVIVSVKDGVVTLSGTVQSDADRLSLEANAKAADAKNIKSVVNNLSVESPTVVINSNDADLTAKIIDATKDFPNIQATSKDGVITVTGQVEQARVMVLKQALDALNPKRVDMSAVVVK